MRKWMNLVESGQVTHHVEMTGAHSGQKDLVLNFYMGKKRIGYIEYTEFRGEVHVKMIKVLPEYRRNGFGTMMLRTLQQEYPDTEIQMGMLTPDGAALVDAMPKREVPNRDVETKMSRIAELKARLDDYKRRHDDLMASIGEPDFEEKREAFVRDAEDWNDLADEEWKLRREIGDKKAIKRIFEFVIP